MANKEANVYEYRLGRLRKTKPPRGISDRDATPGIYMFIHIYIHSIHIYIHITYTYACIPGRILCDTYKSSKEFLRETAYSLTSLSASQLACDRQEIDPIDVPKFFSNSQDIIRLGHHTMNDAFLVQGLMLKLELIPLTLQLTVVSGNLWSRTMFGMKIILYVNYFISKLYFFETI